MLYSFLKIFVGTARWFFCRRIIINKPELLKEKGPLLLACNHPNSFLDAVIMDILFTETIWPLTRGDAFKNNFVRKIMTSLKMLPVYRPSEGVENLSENYKTFDACIDIFKKKGVVLIFSEGLCVNEWHLRSLKKGTARLAIKCQDDNIPLRILPVGFNYSSFRRFGKNLFLNFGTPFTLNEINANESDGVRNQAFNNRLQKELEPLVFEIDKKDKQKQSELLEIRPSLFTKIILFLPAVVGWLIHAPLYLPVKKFTFKKFGHTVHIDSIMTAFIVFSYPVYLILIFLILFIIIKSSWVFTLFLILPFTAWSYLQVKGQLDQ